MKSSFHALLWSSFCLLSLTVYAGAQTCLTSTDMDQPTRTAIETAAKKYFDMAARGDSASLKQNAIPSLASGFGGVENAVRDNQENFSGVQGTVRPPFELKAEGPTPDEYGEFLCGVFGKNGQTPESAVFVIPNLPPGNYAIATLDAATKKGPYTMTLVLQQMGTDWKLGGFYVKEMQVNGHDAKWFAEKAREYKGKSWTRDAYYYFQEARDLSVPVVFMSTQATDNLYTEMQAVKPADLPGGGKTEDLATGAKTYKLTTMFPLVVGKDLDLVVKYQTDSIADTAKAFQDNMAVIKGIVTKYPEFRDAFDGIVARGVAPSGQDYGSLLPMKDIK